MKISAKDLCNILCNTELLYGIDRYFANYLCSLQYPAIDKKWYRVKNLPSDIQDDYYQLWLLGAFTSYFVHTGDSAFSPNRIKDITLEEIFLSDNRNIAVSWRRSAPSPPEHFQNCFVPELDIERLMRNDRVITTNPSEKKPLIFDGKLFYIYKFFEYETTVAEFIKKQISKRNYSVSYKKAEINNLFPQNYIDGDKTKINYQKVAAILSLSSSFVIISGGPGTGKTTTVAKIITLLRNNNYGAVIKAVAPTGKAAERLKESFKNFKTEYKNKIENSLIEGIPDTAESIHKFLGLNKRNPRYDKYRKAPVDVLIIDEASMISLPLFAKIFEALPESCRVIILGDKDQLMAVENGNVLRDMTDINNINAFSSEFVNLTAEVTDNGLTINRAEEELPVTDITVQLEHSWRFGSDSGIGVLAKAVNNAKQSTQPKNLFEIFERYDDIVFCRLTEKDIKEKNFMHSFYDDYIKPYFEKYVELIEIAPPEEILKQLRSFKLLCAINEGIFGVNGINNFIEDKLFPHKADSMIFYHGQPIIITKNDYRLNLMNGDIGVILKDNNGILRAYFYGVSSDDDIRKFNPANLEEYQTAFAISIHKSQGAEFDNVFIILPPDKNPVITKELLYTAITRAKKSCHIFAMPEIFCYAAVTPVKRQSGLKNKLLRR